MKKILYFCSTFHPENSGYANAFKNFILAISQKGDFEIHLVTTKPLGDNEEISIHNCKIVRLKTITDGNSSVVTWMNKIYFANQLNTILAKGSFDILFFETIEEALILSLLKRKHLKRILFRIHATFETEYTVFFPRLIFRLNRFLLRNFVVPHIQYISSTSSYHNDFYKEHFLGGNLFLIAKRYFFVIPNTIFAIKDTLVKRSEYPRSIFFLGRMNEEGFLQKGFEDFINACILLGKDYLIGKCRITIVGQGPYFPLIKSKVERNGLDGIITLVPQLSNTEVQAALKITDIVVLPSRFEGMSMFALEAISNGAFVIFSNTGGLVDMVRNNGLLFQPQNIGDLSEKIRFALEMPASDLITHQMMSYELFWNKFSPDKIREDFIKITSIVNS